MRRQEIEDLEVEIILAEDQVKAAKDSIEKWTMRAEGTHIEPSGRACALCMQNTYCKDCPVTKAGFTKCGDEYSAFFDYADLWERIEEDQAWALDRESTDKIHLVVLGVEKAVYTLIVEDPAEEALLRRLAERELQILRETLVWAEIHLAVLRQKLKEAEDGNQD